METWRKVWRQGVADQLTTAGLEALQQALLSDDERLLQGATTSPPPLMCMQDWAVEGACPIGFCGWHGTDMKTVGEVEEYFGQVCYRADQSLDEPAAIRHLLNWWDEHPREEVRRELLVEVGLALTKRRDAGFLQSVI